MLGFLKLSVIMLGFLKLSVTMLSRYGYFCYDIIMLTPVMRRIFILTFIIMIAVMLDANILSFIILSDILQCVLMMCAA